MKFDKTDQELKLEKAKLECITMINFYLAAGIFAGIGYAIYRLGQWIWG